MKIRVDWEKANFLGMFTFWDGKQINKIFRVLPLFMSDKLDVNKEGQTTNLI